MLKSAGDAIVSSLLHVFNLSLSAGQFPTAWKTAKVTPVYKSGDKQLDLVTNSTDYLITFIKQNFETVRAKNINSYTYLQYIKPSAMVWKKVTLLSILAIVVIL